MNQLDKFIAEAESLKTMDYKSPQFALWKNKVKKFVQNNYGDDHLNIFENSLSWGHVIIAGEGQQMHEEALGRAIEFLHAIKKES